jgi:outer membrane protein OmpA-like peptidoglycan-associated protein
MTLDICPTDYGSFPEDAPPLTCGCSAATVKTGTVWGTNPYYYQSGLCRAALHAGAIGAEGGQIVVQPKKSAFYPAVSRNSVEARSSGGGPGFSVSATSGGGRPGSPVFDAASSAGLTLDICPIDYGSFPEDAPPLTCGCSAATVKTGTVWGANPYYYQSGLCRAALHAGVISAEGGKIEVKPEKAAFYPAVSRNGVETRSSSEGTGFRVTAVPGSAPVAAAARPSVDPTGKPIQAPIASTLRETGRVQLYINFATDQARPLPSSEPVLQELLATLQGDKALRVILIGHTDNQGSAPYNLDLSQRRAAAVYLWLIQHGVDSGRLRADGRGLMEPIADNTSESGRALNRRVEVKASN